MSSSNLRPLSERLSFFKVPQPDPSHHAPPQKRSKRAPQRARDGSKSQLLSASDIRNDIRTTDALWVDAYQPLHPESLAVHKRKVEDVKNWIQEAVFNDKLSKYRRLLILSGPAGSGKTATLKALCREMELDLVEFSTGEGGTDSADNLPSQFPAFLSRAAYLPTLSYASTSSDTLELQDNRDKAPRPKVLLLEDLPNIFTSTVTSNAFQSALRRFLSRSSQDFKSPLVIIVSDALSKNSDDSRLSWKENVTSRTVIPADVMSDHRCTEIRFNPIAPTLLKKALNNLLDSACSPSAKPSSKTLENLIQSSNGDIRSAIHALQFLNLDPQVQLPSEAGSRGNKGKRKRDVDGNANTNPQKDVGHLDFNMVLFHVLGRILYNKRWGEIPEEDAKDNKRQKPPPSDPMPDYLDFKVRNPSKCDVNALYKESSVDAMTMIPYLQENYIPFTTDIDQIADISDSLSSADSLCRDSAQNSTFIEYSFQSVVRSFQMYLPSPVPRKGQKFTKSQLWGKQRELRENDMTLWALGLDLAKRNNSTGLEYSLSQLSMDIVPFFKYLPKAIPYIFKSSIKPLATIHIPERYQQSFTSTPREALGESDIVQETYENDDEKMVHTTLEEKDGLENDLDQKNNPINGIDNDTELLYLVDDDIVNSDDDFM